MSQQDEEFKQLSDMFSLYEAQIVEIVRDTLSQLSSGDQELSKEHCEYAGFLFSLSTQYRPELRKRLIEIGAIVLREDGRALVVPEKMIEYLEHHNVANQLFKLADSQIISQKHGHTTMKNAHFARSFFM